MDVVAQKYEVVSFRGQSRWLDGSVIGPSGAFSNANGRLAGRVTGGEGKGDGKCVRENAVAQVARKGL